FDLERLEPLGIAEWLAGPPGWAPADRVRAAAIFGRSARLRAAIDPSRSLEWNLCTLLLAPDAPFGSTALDRVRAGVQRPERYLRVVEALARGLVEWGEIGAFVGDLSSSGQLGPYLSTLEDLGIVCVERSLDAGSRTRRRRYRLTDPHIGFWFSCVLPAWSRLGVIDAGDLWREEVGPRLAPHLERTLPVIVREWLMGPGGAAVFGARAREVGGLWGEGYDLDLAGTLTNGAIIYGWTRWASGSFDPSTLEASAGQLRRTRYGFARESRIRLLVQRDPPEHALARLDARDPEVRVLSVNDLVGR
ncbi:MAG: hypothetical protein RQ745_09470, partial [Longimicrobiales bacterium]|nr:hypothetical protein [Longimicrobiales bacterium]